MTPLYDDGQSRAPNCLALLSIAFSTMPAKRSPTVVLVLLISLAGCGTSGPQIAPVHGRLTLDDQPLVNADLLFQPDGAQRASTGRTDRDGRYELAYKRGQMGAIVGPHTVRIEISKEVVRNPPPIPERYAAKSELHADVQPGDNEFNFDLKSDAK
jgi:hypothetical protein